jgi:hypothetical protein
MKKTETGYIVVAKSIDHEDYKDSKIIRVKMNLQTLEFKKVDENKTSISVMINLESGGWVPNYASKQLVKMVLGKFCEELQRDVII